MHARSQTRSQTRSLKGLRLLEVFTDLADFDAVGLDALDVHNLASAHTRLGVDIDRRGSLRPPEDVPATPEELEIIRAGIENGRDKLRAQPSLTWYLQDAERLRGELGGMVRDLKATRTPSKAAFLVYLERLRPTIDSQLWTATIANNAMSLEHNWTTLLLAPGSLNIRVEVDGTWLVYTRSPGMWISSRDTIMRAFSPEWIESLAIARILCPTKPVLAVSSYPETATDRMFELAVQEYNKNLA